MNPEEEGGIASLFAILVFPRRNEIGFRGEDCKAWTEKNLRIIFVFPKQPQGITTDTPYKEQRDEV